MLPDALASLPPSRGLLLDLPLGLPAPMRQRVHAILAGRHAPVGLVATLHGDEPALSPGVERGLFGG
jgi:hypothetical protein